MQEGGRFQAGSWQSDLFALALAAGGLVLCAPLLREAEPAAAYLLLPGLLLVIGVFAGRIAAHLRLPRLTGYIVLGAAVGPHFPSMLAHLGGFVDEPFHAVLEQAQVKSITLVNDLAIGLIALLAGLEIRVAWLRARLGNVTGIAVAQTLVVPVLVMTVVLLMAPTFTFIGEAEAVGISPWLPALLLGVIALANSPMVVISVIKDNQAWGPLSETALGVSVIKDVIVILSFTVLIAIIDAMASSDGSMLHVVGTEGGKAIGYLMLSVLVGIPIGWALAWVSERSEHRLGWLVVGVALVVTALQAFHIKPLFCLLMAGFVCENLSPRRTSLGTHHIERALSKVTAPVFVMFFVAAGLKLDLNTLVTAWLAVLGLFLARLLGTVVSAWVGARTTGGEVSVRRWTWAAMIPQAGVTLGFAAIVSKQFPGWGETLASIVIAAVAIHELLGPIVLTFALKRCGEAGQERDLQYSLSQA